MPLVVDPAWLTDEEPDDEIEHPDIYYDPPDEFDRGQIGYHDGY